jgi:hypothetical protein
LDGDYIVIREGVLPLALETLILAGDWTLRPRNVLSRCQAIVKLVLNHSAVGGYIAMGHSMYPPNMETLVLGPKTTEGNAPLKIPGSVKKLVFHMRYSSQLAVGALPEGLTHLELVNTDFAFLSMTWSGFPQTLKYVNISMTGNVVGVKYGMGLAVDFMKLHRPDILVEVGVTEYEDVFKHAH